MDHLPVYVSNWDLAEAELGLEAFSAFLLRAGVKFEADSELKKVLEAFRGMKATGRHSPREMFEERMMVSANKTLTAAGDPRRMIRELGEVRRWRLMTPEEIQQATVSGAKFEKAGADTRRLLFSFLTIPVALGTYVLTVRIVRHYGADDNIAWFAALAVYFIVRQILNRTVLKKR